ncbi:hypothetical protein BJF88_14125 [Cellulosimicrobium sp. CUA-896]|nr:hypothetical protein BJF88_14125 [Cellulosimicrobium sp. CUA-896]
MRSRTSAAVSVGRRSARSRNRSISASSSTPSARVRNLRTYCARPNGRAPSGCASATAISRTIRPPSASSISTRPPNAFSAGSVAWYRRVHSGSSAVVMRCHSSTVSGRAARSGA